MDGDAPAAVLFVAQPCDVLIWWKRHSPDHIYQQAHVLFGEFFSRHHVNIYVLVAHVFATTSARSELSSPVAFVAGAGSAARFLSRAASSACDRHGA